MPEAVYGPGKTAEQPWFGSHSLDPDAFARSLRPVIRKQLGAALGWTGHAEDQLERSQAYQAFIFKHAAESFRTMRVLRTT